MPYYVLGISAFYHDAATCLVKDGEVIAAAQEERFSRLKHDLSFPVKAIQSCLEQGGIKSSDLHLIAYYEKPLLKFERLLETYLAYAPRGITSFLAAMPQWLRQKLWVPEYIKRHLPGFRGNIVYPEHHQSHAASAFYPSPFQRAAFLTLDGVGEWTTTSYGIGRGNYLEIQSEIRFPHSLGLLYSAFTYYLGFKVNSGEYKVMGLAPYGEPQYVEQILDNLIDLKEDGSFRLNLEYFNFCTGLTMTNARFHRLFEGPPRQPESQLRQKDMNLARSIQAVTEEVMLRAARHIKQCTSERNLCLAGGVALNCVGNSRILREGPFDSIWIQPAAGDAGGALGAALYAWHRYLGEARTVTPLRVERNTKSQERGALNPSTGATIIAKDFNGAEDGMQGAYLGPAYSNEQIESALKKFNARYLFVDTRAIPEVVAELLTQQKVLGFFQGRMEYGPRALGARSILADPRSAEMQSTVNTKIKFREGFRPFAPSVLAEHVDDWFALNSKGKFSKLDGLQTQGPKYQLRGSIGWMGSPYMLLVLPVKEARRVSLSAQQKSLQGLAKLQVVRSKIQAVTHVDYSARVQTVHRETNPLYHAVIDAFYLRTGCPLVLNTSFNMRGDPIVCSPTDAYACFMRTNMNALIMGNFLLKKGDQPTWQEGKTEKEKPIATRSLRLFGATLALLLFLLVGYNWWYHKSGWPGFAAGALFLSMLTALAPKFLSPLYRVLMQVAGVMGQLNTKLVLFVTFYGMLAPVGLIRNLFGRSPVERKLEREATTYWSVKQEDHSTWRCERMW